MTDQQSRVSEPLHIRTTSTGHSSTPRLLSPRSPGRLILEETVETVKKETFDRNAQGEVVERVEETRRVERREPHAGTLNYYSQLYVVPAVDAVEAGKGQLEISVNQGRVPNNVQMQGAGRWEELFKQFQSSNQVI